MLWFSKYTILQYSVNVAYTHCMYVHNYYVQRLILSVPNSGTVGLNDIVCSDRSLRMKAAPYAYNIAPLLTVYYVYGGVRIRSCFRTVEIYTCQYGSLKIGSYIFWL